MKRNTINKALCLTFACCLALVSTSFSAAKSPRISANSKKIFVGETFVLKISNANKTVKWSTSNSKIAKIKSKAGTKDCRARIKAVKNGSATITAKIGSKKLKCKITVKKVTQEYKNALEKADFYANNLHMSKAGLYDQLTSRYGEGFSADVAQYAVDHVKTNWKKNALEKGKFYYTKLNMSKQRVYEQLVSEYGEQFTPEEARFAIRHLDD